MDLPVNQFKQKLASGKTQYGFWLGLPDNTAAEICATAGFDWLLIDGEHAPYDIRSTLSHLQVLAAYDVAPVVRPAEGNVALIKRLLDIGAQSLLIPMVDNAEDVQQLVRAVRYPPEGIRGVGTSLARASRWNAVPGYLQKARDEIFLTIQVETKAALENLENISRIEGLDAVFIGPSDLSAAMGHIGNPGHPEVVEKISSAIRTIKAAGKYSGLMSLDPSMVEKYAGIGASFIAVGVDTMVLSQATKRLASQYKAGNEQNNTIEQGTAGY